MAKKSEKREPLVRVNGRDPKQCRWTYYRASGAGGQHRNKKDTAARVTHLASGVTAQASEHKSREQNKKAAWRRLYEHPKFRLWLKMESARVSGWQKELENYVHESMRPHNLRVERRGDDGAWETWRSTDPDWSEDADA